MVLIGRLHCGCLGGQFSPKARHTAEAWSEEPSHTTPFSVHLWFLPMTGREQLQGRQYVFLLVLNCCGRIRAVALWDASRVNPSPQAYHTAEAQTILPHTTCRLFVCGFCLRLCFWTVEGRQQVL